MECWIASSRIMYLTAQDSCDVNGRPLREPLHWHGLSSMGKHVLIIHEVHGFEGATVHVEMCRVRSSQVRIGRNREFLC